VGIVHTTAAINLGAGILLGVPGLRGRAIARLGALDAARPAGGG